jgi:hypothetical protein
MNTTYTLNLVTDLLEVPDDRLNTCLNEMKVMIRAMRTVRAAAFIDAQEDDIDVDHPSQLNKVLFPNVRWVDDGDATVRVQHGSDTLIAVAPAPAATPDAGRVAELEAMVRKLVRALSMTDHYKRDNFDLTAAAHELLDGPDGDCSN